MWSKVDETTPNDADFLVGVTTGAPTHQTFGFAAFSVPADAVIQNLTVYYRAAKIASQGANIRASLKVNGVYYDTTDAGVNPSQTPTITTYSRSFTVNPATGAAWTPADINGTGTNPLQAFGVTSTDLAPDVNVYMNYAQVNYTRTVAGAAVMTGSGTLAGAAKRNRKGLAALTASGSLSGIGKRTIRASSSLTGAGVLLAVGKRTIRAVAALAGMGTLTAAGQVIPGGGGGLYAGGFANANRFDRRGWGC